MAEIAEKLFILQNAMHPRFRNCVTLMLLVMNGSISAAVYA